MHFYQKFKYCPVCGVDSFSKHDFKSMICLQCGFIYYINSAGATAVFITNEDGDLLVCTRAKEPAKGTLDLPGGFIDYSETAEQGAIREVKEETGIELKSVKYKFSIPNNYQYMGLNIPTIDICFEANVDNNVQIDPADDVQNAKFVPLSEINPKQFGLNSIRQAVSIFIDNSKK